ncbi:MAG TPA: hypothetical protein VEO54_30645 [Thermoanaerobaculia bacterium]|nr:hypothetical protein [Thermoanaerobaculia bacterium]
MPLRGFFITAFGDRSSFVHHALNEQAQINGATLDKLDASWSRLHDLPPSDNPLDLLARLSQMLTASDFVVVDLSPPDGSGKFNPNVMFELGRALELKRPIYSICDHRVLEARALPFDIAPLHAKTYELSPEGLQKLALDFGEWLKGRQHKRQALSQKLFLDLVTLRDQLASWDESTLHRFGPVIDVVMRRLKEYAAIVSSANSNKQGHVAFAPLRRQDMIEAVFCSTLRAMQKPDEYDTVSTLEFWREIEGDRGAQHQSSFHNLLSATKTALENGVTNRRLFLVQGWNLDSAKANESLIEGHEALRKNFPDKYTLGYYVVTQPNTYLNLKRTLHVGVCRVPSQGVDFVLQPEYSVRSDGSERLVALNYLLGTTEAQGFALAISNLWDSENLQGERFSNWADVISETRTSAAGVRKG